MNDCVTKDAYGSTLQKCDHGNDLPLTGSEFFLPSLGVGFALLIVGIIIRRRFERHA